MRGEADAVKREASVSEELDGGVGRIGIVGMRARWR